LRENGVGVIYPAKVVLKDEDLPDKQAGDAKHDGKREKNRAIQQAAKAVRPEYRIAHNGISLR
jgi:hypothetical protein